MEPKGAASLTAGLLARKGLARPAMRRQTVTGLGATVGPRAIGALDDLGWNDMGEDAETPAAVPTAAPSPVAQHIAAIQETLARRDEARAKGVPAPAAPAAPALAPKQAAPRKAKVEALSRAATGTHRKSAFTLRIDAERHLRLRLLSAVTNLSAQQLLIGALDALIEQNPHIDALATDPKVRAGTTD
ncbi:MAG: hypothetical protein QM690_21910 [Sphingobium sp.]